MKRDPLFWFGAIYMFLMVLLAVFGPFIRHDYLMPVGPPFAPPSAEFWLGTDELGRDVFARLAYGARISLFIGFSVMAISVSIGLLVGLLGAFGPPWISVPLMRLTDAMFAFPDILLAILIIGVWSMGVGPVIVALSITLWPPIARIIRSQCLSIKEREFVVASRAMGATTPYLVFKHVVPQLFGILLAVAVVDLAGTILAESTLSFLGIGVQAPEPSWGSMINNARSEMNSHPLLLLWPCLTLSLTILALNFIGDAVRAQVDPRMRAKF
ncbi:MAG: ABC transporter permease [Fimbriimonadaceae bacterium]